jgi:hypothetical protein
VSVARHAVLVLREREDSVGDQREAEAEADVVVIVLDWIPPQKGAFLL